MSPDRSQRHKKGAGRAPAARPHPHSSLCHNNSVILPRFFILFAYTHTPERAGRRGGARW